MLQLTDSELCAWLLFWTCLLDFHEQHILFLITELVLITLNALILLQVTYKKCFAISWSPNQSSIVQQSLMPNNQLLYLFAWKIIWICQDGQQLRFEGHVTDNYLRRSTLFKLLFWVPTKVQSFACQLWLMEEYLSRDGLECITIHCIITP